MVVLMRKTGACGNWIPKEGVSVSFNKSPKGLAVTVSASVLVAAIWAIADLIARLLH
jgi:hypothetical protein